MFRSRIEAIGRKATSISFVLARFEQDQVVRRRRSADARTLARRLYFDLTGLPPTPQQVADFEKAVQQRW